MQGWCSTLPLGLDLLKIRRTFDTDALATVFPFTSADLVAPPDAGSRGSTSSPVLYGVNASGSRLVLWDRWQCDNHNSVVLARSGAGKSYLTKLEILRSLYQDVQVMVVDPEQEYTRLAEAVGGTVVELGAPNVRINPLDIPQVGAPSSDAVRRRALFAHTVVAVLLGSELTGGQQAALDTAILAAYTDAGITEDVQTHSRPAPTLRDVADLLAVLSGSRGRGAGREAHAAHDGILLRAFRRPDHDLSRGAPRGVRSAAAPGGAEGHRDAPGPGCDLAHRI